MLSNTFFIKNKKAIIAKIFIAIKTIIFYIVFMMFFFEIWIRPKIRRLTA